MRILLSVLVVTVAMISTPVNATAQSCSDDLQCAADEMCWLPTGVCLTEDPVGECRPSGALYCPDVWLPVCGCNFQTYSNDCYAQRNGVSIAYVGECDGAICGGPQALSCANDQYCDVPDGQCGAIYGQCRPSPTACSATCAPVCGCDGLTYSNACEAQRAGSDLQMAGTCDPSTDREVEGVRFVSREQLVWDQENGALAYNVYRGVFDAPPVDGVNDCYASAVPGFDVSIVDNPPAGEIWSFQISAEFFEGEGPLGSGSHCRRRVAPTDCD